MRAFIAFMMAAAVCVTACSLSPEQKEERIKQLKASTGGFIGAVISGNYADVQKYTTGRFDGAAALEQHLKQPWAVGPTLMLGTVASMAWVNDSTAKVKVVWTFQQGTQQSYSAETLLWVWKGGTWKYDGRTLR